MSRPSGVPHRRRRLDRDVAPGDEMEGILIGVGPQRMRMDLRCGYQHRE